MAIYSALVVERAIEVHFLLAQEMAPPFSRKANPPSHFQPCPDPKLPSKSPPLWLLDPYCILRSTVPAT